MSGSGATGLRAPREILFGAGSIEHLGRMARFHGTTAFVCTDAHLSSTEGFQRALSSLSASGVATTIFTNTDADVPITSIDEGVARAAPVRPDSVIGLGGGSCIDMAKLVALQLNHAGPVQGFYGENRVPGPCTPVLAVPTTAGTGSEVSPVAVLADPVIASKVGISSPFLVPTGAICDPELTLTCPPSVTAHSGADAMVHAIEAFVAARRPGAWSSDPLPVFGGKNPLSDLFAREAVRLVGRSLEAAYRNPHDIDARTDLLQGSLLAGLAFARAGTGGAHALQYPIGTLTGTPHGLGVALMLPYVLSYILPVSSQELALLAPCLDVEQSSVMASATSVIEAIQRLNSAVGIPTTLTEIGVTGSDTEFIVSRALQAERLIANSPRKLDSRTLQLIVRAAILGDPEVARDLGGEHP